MGKNENDFQSELIKDIKTTFGDDIMVLKNDPNYIRGIPDLTILDRKTAKWAFLECKKSEKDMKRRKDGGATLQEYYISHNGCAYASFVYPENRSQVLNELQQSLRS